MPLETDPLIPVDFQFDFVHDLYGFVYTILQLRSVLNALN